MEVKLTGLEIYHQSSGANGAIVCITGKSGAAASAVLWSGTRNTNIEYGSYLFPITVTDTPVKSVRIELDGGGSWNADVCAIKATGVPTSASTSSLSFVQATFDREKAGKIG